MISMVDCLSGWAAPAAILNPATAPGAVWAEALATGDAGRARSSFVADLRAKPFLPAPELAYLPLAERWTGFGCTRNGGHNYDPDDVVRQHYVGVYGIAHTFEQDIDWLFDPTRDWGEHQTPEWQVQFNRHYHWIALARAWQRSGKVEYAQAFERELIGWVTSQCPAPPRKDMRLPGTWRTIEVGIRAGWTWPLALEIFRTSDAVSDTALWLMVAAMREHGRYLLMSPTGGNFKTMENNGMAHVGMLLPALLDAEVYASTALDRTVAEMERQFYPDGCQDELASSYGRLSATCTFCTLKLAENSGLNEGRGTRLSPWLWQRLRKMVAVYARIAAPDGRVPGFHDCDGISVERMFADLKAWPGDGAQTEQPPWRQDTGTTHIPWGGYGILRREERWSLLDGGPWGSGHQHSDALQVVTWSDGAFWCVDPGKPTYNRSPETRLIRSSEGHNVMLMDGLRHLPEPQINRTAQPLPMALADGDGLSFAAAARVARCGAADAAGFRHERLLMDIAGLGWLIVDQAAALDRDPHSWEWLWHLPAGTSLSLLADRAAEARRTDGRRLQLVAAANHELALTTLSGAKAPWRGWAVAAGAADAHPIPLIAATCAATSTPVVCATWLSLQPVPPDALSLHHTGDDTVVSIADPANPLTLTLSGETEWHTLAADQAGKVCRLALPSHSFPIRG